MRAAHEDDTHLDDVMHKNIVTANNREEKEYSRLMSAQLMEDEKRRHTSEDGESSSPQVQWTPESSGSNRAMAWPGSREKEIMAKKYPNLAKDGRSLFQLSDPSRSSTPRTKASKPNHKVIAVTDSSEEEEAARQKVKQ